MTPIESGTGTVVSGPDQLPEAVEDILETEGTASEKPALAASVVVAWLFREGAEPRQIEVKELTPLADDDGCFVWVDLSGYAPSDLEAIAEHLGLPEPAVRTTRASWQRPRLDIYPGFYFVAVTVPRMDIGNHHLLASELDLFVGRNVLVSAHKIPLPFTERVMTRAGQNPDLMRLDSAFLLSIIIDELLIYFEELTEGLEDEIESLEERALTESSDVLLEDLLRFKRFVFAVYRLARQHLAIVDGFLRPDFPLVGGDDIEPYFRDLDARLGRLLDGLDIARESVTGAFEIYVSQVGHRTNDVMKVLTIVSTVLLPSSVILGFFGTSFENPYFTNAVGFVAMVVLIGLTTIGCVVLFYRWGWIRQSAAKRPANDPSR